MGHGITGERDALTRRHWLLKTEPETFSFEDLAARDHEPWDGVRNYQARNNLRAMKKGDLALIYHSVEPRAVVGVAVIVREAYPDPTIDDERWSAVDVRALRALEEPVTLATIKADASLADIALVRHSRLSVMPLEAEHFERILALGRTKLPEHA